MNSTENHRDKITANFTFLIFYIYMYVVAFVLSQCCFDRAYQNQGNCQNLEKYTVEGRPIRGGSVENPRGCSNSFLRRALDFGWFSMIRMRSKKKYALG